MKQFCTGVILAGGQNSRMSKQNKAFISIGGEKIIDRLIEIYRPIFNEIIIVTNNPDEYYDLNVKIVKDIYKQSCTLAGLHSGLFHASNPWIFVAPCDLPFLKSEMIQTVLDCIRSNYSIIIPETTTGLEPLCAAYSKKNLPKIEENLEAGIYKLQGFFKQKLTRKISERLLRSADPTLQSFININTPQDLIFAENIQKQEL